MDMTIRKAGIAFAAILILIFGAYYATLPSQDAFLRDIRWVSDKSALNLSLENEINAIFTYETPEIRERLPKNYRVGNNIVSFPIENEEEYLEEVLRFKDAVIATGEVPIEDVDAYFDTLTQSYVLDELQYTAALTRVDLRLQIEYLQRLSPNIPPIVVSTELVDRTIYALSIRTKGAWRVRMLLEVAVDGSELAPVEALVRYLGIEPTMPHVEIP
ncbi:MAG: hypothetical protein KO463_02915 [Candidatus Methanofastidiosa archaeon]|nr:hypothetical protein [Candidatus Methanofastidiosa archaeon]